MVLIVELKTIKGNGSIKFLLNNEYLKKTAKLFNSKNPIKFTQFSNTLHVFQKEFVHLKSNDCKLKLSSASDYSSKICFIGSSEATTCVIVGMKSKVNGNCFLGHLDGDDGQFDEFENIVKKNFSKSDEIIVHIVGGYSEESGCSEKIINNIIKVFQSDKERNFHLETFFVDKQNSKFDFVKGILFPIHTDMCMNIVTGDAFPSIYDDNIAHLKKMPDYGARRVRVSYGDGKLFQVVYENEVLVINPFVFKGNELDLLFKLGCLDDKTILKYCSTSPDVEAPDFVPILREGWKFQQKYRTEKDYFKEWKPRKYKYLKNTNGKGFYWSKI